MRHHIQFVTFLTQRQFHKRHIRLIRLVRSICNSYRVRGCVTQFVRLGVETVHHKAVNPRFPARITEFMYIRHTIRVIQRTVRCYVCYHVRCRTDLALNAVLHRYCTNHLRLVFLYDNRRRVQQFQLLSRTRTVQRKVDARPFCHATQRNRLRLLVNTRLDRHFRRFGSTRNRRIDIDVRELRSVVVQDNQVIPCTQASVFSTDEIRILRLGAYGLRTNRLIAHKHVHLY